VNKEATAVIVFLLFFLGVIQHLVAQTADNHDFQTWLYIVFARIIKVGHDDRGTMKSYL